MPIFRKIASRAPGSGALRIRGLIVAVVLAVVGTYLYQAYTGKFADRFKLTVITNTIGEGLAPGAEVKFHGLAIGSVKAVQSIGYDKQKMTVLLDPRQAKVLTADTIARFTSSNLFGTAAVELISDGKGPPLRSDQTLVMHTDAQAASVTALLRQGQRLSRILDTPELNHLIDMLAKHADIAEPAVKAGLDLARILADSQTMPISESLSKLASLLNSLSDILPAIGLTPTLLDAIDPLVAPGGVDRTNLVMRQTGQLVTDAGQIVVRNNAWLIQLVGAIMNVASPAMFAVGSLAPAYDRISGLLDRTSTAFPLIDGQVRIRTEVILDTAPGIAAALPSAPGEPAPGEPAPGEPAPGGGE